MRWIKYQIVQCVINDENVLVTKKVGYNDANIVIAQNEAYNGQYEIIEDDIPEPQTQVIPTKLSELENDLNLVDDKHEHDEYVNKSGDTMDGILVANNNESYTVKQVRNIFLVAEGNSIPAGSDGDICIIYAP